MRKGSWSQELSAFRSEVRMATLPEAAPLCGCGAPSRLTSPTPNRHFWVCPGANKCDKPLFRPAATPTALARTSSSSSVAGGHSTLMPLSATAARQPGSIAAAKSGGGRSRGGGGASAGGAKGRLRPAVASSVAAQVVASSASASAERELQCSADVAAMLLPHQRRGLAWMAEREEPPRGGAQPAAGPKSGAARGGILSDEMGLGKTLQVIALALTRRPERMVGVGGGARGATLVVCPKSVLRQWSAEIGARCEAGRVRVLEYHGPQRPRGSGALGEFDFVVTTYGTVQSEHKELAAGKENANVRGAKGGLFALEWHRVVLDEAHVIKNAKTQACDACVALASARRWALTGTPVQNSSADLFGLARFLHARPFDEWKTFRKQFGGKAPSEDEQARLRLWLRTFNLRRTHAGLEERGDSIAATAGRAASLPPLACETHLLTLSGAERRLYDAQLKEARQQLGYRPSTAPADQGKLVRLKLKRDASEPLTRLLRLRQLCSHPSLVVVVPTASAEAAAADPPFKAPPREDASDKLTSMLEGLSIKRKPPAAAVAPAAPPPNRGGSGHPCAACGSSAPDAQFSKSQRSKGALRRCKACVGADRRAPAAASEPAAAAAADELTSALDALSLAPQRSSEPEEVDWRNHASTKTAALAERLRAMPLGEKALVFSQWTSMLDLLERELPREGLSLGVVRLDGSMSRAQQKQAIDALAVDAGARLMLISLNCGGVGLNLTAANHVHFMELWWNPAVEEQAVGRCHRIGQTRPVCVHRYIADGTVEQQMLAVQRGKKAAATGALGKNASADSGLTGAEVERLFLGV